MQDVTAMLARWGLDEGQVRRQIYRATDARERERWHALWLLDVCVWIVASDQVLDAVRPVRARAPPTGYTSARAATACARCL